jgi:hypothetical protein
MSVDRGVAQTVAAYLDSLPPTINGYAIELWGYFCGMDSLKLEPDPTRFGLAPIEVATVKMVLLSWARQSTD